MEELIIHTMLIIGGLVVWAGFTLLIAVVIFIFSTWLLEHVTGKHLDIYRKPVCTLRKTLLIAWIIVLLLSILFYVPRINVELYDISLSMIT
jgi:uncharacterized protein with PQ loop repeat